MDTIRTTPVLSFKAEAPGKRELETDFALLWEDSIHGEHRQRTLFGECKTYGSVGHKDFDRMRYLAKMFPTCRARLQHTPNHVHVAGNQATHTNRESGRRYWKAGRPINPVLLLTGTELFREHQLREEAAAIRARYFATTTSQR